jgi:hypothetical protein
MIVGISSGAEADISDGYWFYERQSIGLGDYFRTCIFADVESLAYTAAFTKVKTDFIDVLGNDFHLAFTTRLRTNTSQSWQYSTLGVSNCLSFGMEAGHRCHRVVVDGSWATRRETFVGIRRV